jgi:signal transduction histidine kinase
VSSGVLYVLGVLLIATTYGLRLGLFTAALSALALDYFHTDPTGDLFDGKSAGDVVAIANVVITAVVGSVIADRARRRAVEAEEQRVRLHEVHASRSRVVAAADAERRRVVRDLHDGAQQRLVHTVVNLKLAEQLMDVDPEAGRKMVAEALTNAQLATTELRELAHGILPSVLTGGGLSGAVDALASRMPIPVTAEVPDERFAAEDEATAYFVIAEALTNVAKHAQASEAWVTVTANCAGGVSGDPGANGPGVGGAANAGTASDAAGWLYVEVRDDGIGGAFLGGSGMSGLLDRLAAVQGTLTLESPKIGRASCRERVS